MAFFLSKALWLLARPSHLVLLVLLIGTVLLLARRARAGKVLIAGSVLLLAAIAVLPLAHWIAHPLESRFPVPRLTAGSVDGIVVLGGALGSDSGSGADLNAAADRFTSLLELANRFPEAKIVYTGGSALVQSGGPREADVARDLLTSIGFDVDRVAFERDSRNTRENAVFSHEMAQPSEGETWLLVTSAMHMPRAVGTFRRFGWSVVPYPVDHRVDLDRPLERWFDLSGNLSAIDVAVHEWVGLAAYRWLGYSDSLFPGPRGLSGP